MFRSVTATLTFLAVLTLTACGGPSQEQKDAAVKARAKARKLNKEADRIAGIAITCRDQVGGLIRALRNTDSRLSVGLTFADYGSQVGSISIAYDRMPINQMDIECISKAGVKSESAFNAYREAYNTWNECIGDLYCDTDSIQPELQRKWSKASRLVVQARSALSDLELEAAMSREAADRQAKKADEAEAALE